MASSSTAWSYTAIESAESRYALLALIHAAAHSWSVSSSHMIRSFPEIVRKGLSSEGLAEIDANLLRLAIKRSE
jgi:hypothetical protein